MRFIQGAGQSQSLLTDIGITGGLDLGERESLREEAGRVSSETYTKRSDVLKAMQSLVAFGIDKQVAKQSLEPIARTATAGGATVPDVANSAISLVDNLKIPIGKLSASLEMQAKGADLGGFELRDMAREFPTITAAASGQNITGQEGLASLIAASQIARTASASGSGAATLMTNLIGKIDAPDTVRNFDRFGIGLIERLQEYQAQGINRLDGIIALSSEAVENGARLSELFGDRETKQMITQLLKKRETYERFRFEIATNSEGTVSTMFKDRVDNDPTLHWTRFGERLSSLRDTTAQGLLPVVSDLMASVEPLIERFGGWVKRNQELVTWGAKVLGILLALKIGILAIGFIFGWMGGAAILAIAALTRFRIGFALLKAITPLRWSSLIPKLSWAAMIPKFRWGLKSATRFQWSWLISKLSWVAMIPKFRWGLKGATRFQWSWLISKLSWVAMIPKFRWGLKGTTRFQWSWLISKLSWVAMIPKFRWGLKGATRFRWSWLIQPLRWGARFIPVIGWAALLGELAWHLVIKKVEWSKWFDFGWRDVLPDWDWSKIIPTMPSFSWLHSKSVEKAASAPDEEPGLLNRIGSGIGGMFKLDGARAAGGPVRAGGTYLVGERGPELLRMEAQKGFVIPSALSMALLGAGNPAVAVPSKLAGLQADIRVERTAPLPHRSETGTAQGLNVALSIAPGVISIHAAEGQDPQDIAAAVLEQITREAAPLIEQALDRRKRRHGADLHDGRELFE